MLGMLVDGLQPADLFLQGAALIWLWAPELQLLEAACWCRWQHRHADAARSRAARSAPRTVDGVCTKANRGAAPCG
jgi:hypothetical protein